MFRPLPTRYFHAVPLHRLPFLLASGCLYSHNALRERNLPLGPRPTVARRDKKLRLAGYVHLALEPVTPLLRDKLKKGYPHALLTFAVGVADGTGVAFLKYNPKSWRHREDFFPVETVEEKARFLEEWRAGQYPSAELLVPTALPLAGNLEEIAFCSAAERDWAVSLCPVEPGVSVTVAPEGLPPCAEFVWDAFLLYAEACQAEGSILPPPDLPFD